MIELSLVLLNVVIRIDAAVLSFPFYLIGIQIEHNGIVWLNKKRR